ncbi:DUF2163 domain-containing protein [Desulfatitalea tepidiphila]|uniref:DUF2163 domain-containing protein n=1 Tax=Desulfatitalea tepidiphila TaxID=1185843 RepID=UPI0006B5EE0B|nr:DUF2163 domain-containing protein [Desulfatitalea tepidiphila]
MKASYDQAFIDALKSESARVVFFVNADFTPSPWRVTNLDIDYYVGGELYLSREVTIGEVVMQGGLSVDRVEIRMANAKRELSAILLGADQRGREVSIRVGVVGDNGVMVGSGEPFRGMLSKYEAEDDVAVLSCVSDMVRWRKKTLRKASSSCPWPFKGTECAYGGEETWCDQTYDRCVDLGNHLNFGGNRFLDALAETRIWWGRVQS